MAYAAEKLLAVSGSGSIPTSRLAGATAWRKVRSKSIPSSRLVYKTSRRVWRASRVFWAWSICSKSRSTGRARISISSGSIMCRLTESRPHCEKQRRQATELRWPVPQRKAGGVAKNRDDRPLNNDGLSYKLLAGAYRGRLAEKLVQERLHPSERVHPAAMQQRFVHIVRKHDQLVIHVTLPQELHQSRHLLECDVAIVIALDQEHRRLPAINRADGRRFVRHRLRIERTAPEVDARKIDTDFEDVGVAR